MPFTFSAQSIQDAIAKSNFLGYGSSAPVVGLGAYSASTGFAFTRQDAGA